MVWVGATASLGAHQPDLEGWARSRERRLEAPLSEVTLPPARHDDEAADRVEGLLAEARTQAFSGDAAAAIAALDSAEAVVEGAKELPESAWLMAEILHERAFVVAPREPTAAADYERRATALVGPRAAPFVAAPTSPPAPSQRTSQRTTGAPTTLESAPAAPGPSSTAELHGVLSTDEVELDGVEVSAPRTIPDGAHHVRVLRGGRLAWSGWVTVTGSDVHLPVAPPLPCSATDLAPAIAGVMHAPVLCENYAMARPVGPERIEVAVCHRGSCGEWLPWSRSWGAAFEGPMHPPPRPHSKNPWVVWTTVGVAAVILGGFILAEEGAFEHRGPTRNTFRFEPPK
jgi:hypothetical protein